MSTFAAQVGAWAAKTEARTQAVYRRSVELLAEEMIKTRADGGRLPFDTGNLARSLVASTAGMPKTSEAPAVGMDIGSVTRTLMLNQSVWIAFQAIYARRRNYGFVGADVLGRVFNEDGAYFVEAAIAKWPQLVEQAARELQDEVEGMA